MMEKQPHNAREAACLGMKTTSGRPDGRSRILLNRAVGDTFAEQQTAEQVRWGKPALTWEMDDDEYLSTSDAACPPT